MSTATSYFNSLLRLNCAPLLLEKKIYPNAKEVTESFGCFNATMQAFGGMQACGEDKVCIVVGDGSTPRTAALFALRTRWLVYSYDPNMKDRDWGIERLITVKGKTEDYPQKYDKDIVLVFPHSHASTQKVLATHTVNKDLHKRTVVWLPCCTQMGLNEPCTSFVDTRIISPKNRFYIWENI